MIVPFATVEYMHKEVEAEIKSAFSDVYDSNWFIRGEACKTFENDFAKYAPISYFPKLSAIWNAVPVPNH